MKRCVVPVLLCGALVLPGTALAAAAKPPPKPPPGPPRAVVKVKPKLKGGVARIMSTVRVRGTLAPFAPGQRVAVTFFRNGKPVKRGLRRMGYIANRGRCFKARTARGVLAYRKVNGMTRSMRAGKRVVKRVYAGRGGYRVRHPGAGRHVEAPLGKQVLVFAKGGRATHIYPTSSGTSATPTVTGHYRFHRTEPGYNNLGMYYSWYFHGGYAIHGYDSVPNYPASHGCLRTFIADQPEIYNRIKYGESIFVF